MSNTSLQPCRASLKKLTSRFSTALAASKFSCRAVSSEGCGAAEHHSGRGRSQHRLKITSFSSQRKPATASIKATGVRPTNHEMEKQRVPCTRRDEASTPLSPAPYRWKAADIPSPTRLIKKKRKRQDVPLRMHFTLNLTRLPPAHQPNTRFITPMTQVSPPSRSITFRTDAA